MTDGAPERDDLVSSPPAQEDAQAAAEPAPGPAAAGAPPGATAGADAAATGDEAGPTTAPDRGDDLPPVLVGDDGGATPDGSETDDDGEALVDVEARLDADFAKVLAERDEYLDALQRLQADFANYRRRKERERAEQGDEAVTRLISVLLPVLDAGDLAVAHGGGEGVEQITGALYDTLAKEGLEGIVPKEGEPFDPNEHDAVAHEPGEGDEPEPVVSQLLRAGYRWKGRLLRPAMVKVKG